MQVTRRLLSAALALGLAACSGEPQQAPAAPKATPAPSRPQEPSASPRASGGPAPAPQAPAAAPAEAAAAPAVQPLAPEQLAAGITREQLLVTLGDCARRTHLTPATGAGSRTVESFQPKDAACLKKFGERHFVVAGDRVHAVNSGLREEDRPMEADPAASDSYRAPPPPPPSPEP